MAATLLSFALVLGPGSDVAAQGPNQGVPGPAAQDGGLGLLLQNARAALAQARVPQAIELFTQALRHPAASPQQPALRADIAYELATAYLAAFRETRVPQYLDSAIALIEAHMATVSYQMPQGRRLFELRQIIEAERNAARPQPVQPQVQVAPAPTPAPAPSAPRHKLSGQSASALLKSYDGAAKLSQGGGYLLGAGIPLILVGTGMVIIKNSLCYDYGDGEYCYWSGAPGVGRGGATTIGIGAAFIAGAVAMKVIGNLKIRRLRREVQGLHLSVMMPRGRQNGWGGRIGLRF